MKEGCGGPGTATAPISSPQDYRTSGNTSGNSVTHGRPLEAEIGDYFFLPALGNYFSGKLREFGSSGYYWSSSAYPLSSGRAFLLYFDGDDISLDHLGRDGGFQARPFE